MKKYKIQASAYEHMNDEHRAKCIEAMVGFTHIKPVIMEDCPDAHNVFIVVEGQRFCITQYGCDTLEEAEWIRGELCMALAKMVELCGGKV